MSLCGLIFSLFIGKYHRKRGGEKCGLCQCNIIFHSGIANRYLIISFFLMIHVYNNFFLHFLGLTSLEPEKRFSRICKNLCLLLTALFHFIHNNVSPVLMSLTAGQRSSSELQRHLRALSICFFLIVASLSLMIILWQWFTIGNIFNSKSTISLKNWHFTYIHVYSVEITWFFCYSDFPWYQS